MDIIQEKIDHFEKFQAPVDMTDGGGVGVLPDYYRMGALYYKKLGQYYEIENVAQNEHHTYLRSPLTNPTVTRPIYVRASSAGDAQQNRERRIQVYPITITSNVYCNFIARPTTVRWGYTIVNDQALYNSSATYTTHFELHQSEETELVIKILGLSGLVIKDPTVMQASAGEEAKKQQLEKQ